MSRIAYVNGQYRDMRDASVNIEDRGYQFSDGVYEVCEIRGGKIDSFKIVWEGFNISNFPDNFERIDLRVFDINAESPNYSQQTAYYAEFLPTVDSYERSTKPLQITKYKIKDDKYLTLYIEETEQTFDSTSVIQADAFYKGKNYAYRFSNIFTPDKESSQKLIEEVMKPMLETFKELPE